VISTRGLGVRIADSMQQPESSKGQDLPELVQVSRKATTYGVLDQRDD